MSSEEIAIRVENLGKCYQMYERPQDRLKQSIVPRIKRLFNRPSHDYHREFWALRDVSFEVRRGETVGIIGRNGSGKSTLLQIVCGTLTPTTGSVQVHGRVAALLELGAGFNPEFTGRENVYLNASILGLSQAEIDERFDAIVAFADIGDFIEQPVKTYSSGMFVRLAFAVIAHVDADILVVDEALAVGDAVFIQRCMRFIRRFQERGALLFVSHDTASVINLCQTAVWLSGGTVRGRGAAKEIAEDYLQYTLQQVYGDSVCLEPTRATPVPADETPPASPVPMCDDASEAAAAKDLRMTIADNLSEANGWKTGAAEILSVALERTEPGGDQVFGGGERVRLTIIALAHQPLDQPILGFLVRDRLGQDLFGENTAGVTAVRPMPIAAEQRFLAHFVFRLPLLQDGQYALMASVANGTQHDHVQHHWLHDAMILTVASERRRWGLVGIPFEEVTMEPCL